MNKQHQKKLHPRAQLRVISEALGDIIIICLILGIFVYGAFKYFL